MYRGREKKAGSILISISILFSVCLILSLLGAVPGMAEGTLTLPVSTKKISAEAFYGDTSLDTVVIPEGVTSIGARAFAYSAVKRVTLPASLSAIADSAFEGCSLEIVSVPENTYAYSWARDQGYISIHRALLIGERDFLREKNGYYIETANRNVGDTDNMREMLKNLNGDDGEKYTVISRTNLTYSLIERDIQIAFADTKPNDVSLFFIASHGNSSGDGELEMPFLGDPGSSSDREAHYKNQVLPLETLAEWLESYVQGKVIVILESCGSGSAIYTNVKQNKTASAALAQVSSLLKGNTWLHADTESYFPETVTVIKEGEYDPEVFAEQVVSAFAAVDPGLEVSWGDSVANDTGSFRQAKYYVLTASRHQENSWGTESGSGYNYFTYWLVEGVGTKGSSPADCDPEDERLSLNELYTYIKQYDSYPFNYQGETYYQHVQCYPENCNTVLFAFR